MLATVNTQTSRRKKRGFTLLELMVSMVITTMILGILLGVTRSAIDSWQMNRERVRAARQAKVALDQMSKDFESFQVRGGNDNVWFFAQVDDVGGGATGGGRAAQLAFFTSATDRYNGQIGVDGVDMGGDVSAVGYRLVYKDPIKNDTGDFAVFALYRNLVDPDKSFEQLLGQDELIEPGGNAGPFKIHMDEAGGISNFVCENIYELTVGFLIEYEEEESGTMVTKHRRLSVVDTTGSGQTDELRIRGNGIFADPPPADAEQIERGRLVSVDISITVITDSATNIIRDGNLSGDELAQFVTKNSYRYTRSVMLPHF